MSTAINSSEGCWLPTSCLIATTAPGNCESLDGTSIGSEKVTQTADDDAGLDPEQPLVEGIDPLPKATFAPLSELSEGKSLPKLLLPPEDGLILFTLPGDEGEAFTPLVVPDATLVGPLTITGAELHRIYSYLA